MDLQNILVHDIDKCTGCTFCMIICAYSHFNACEYDLASIRIIENPESRGRFIAIYCSHCEHPICEASCPKNALKKDSQTGIVRINSMMCIGCKSCNILCPIGVPWFHSHRRVSVKCDLCDGEPNCVKFCTAGALKLVPREEARQELVLRVKSGGIRE